MKKHLIVIGTAVLLLVVGLSGCNEQRVQVEDIDIEKNIKGEWIATIGEDTYSFILYNDGKTFKHSLGLYLLGNYFIVGDILECYHEEEEYVPYFQNYYFIEMPDKDTLILTTIGEGTLTYDGEL